MTEFNDGALHLAWGSSTDRGLKRSLNEDAYLTVFPLFLVADGMGGHSAGEIASASALEAFRPLTGQRTVSMDELADAFTVAVTTVAGIESTEFAAGTTLSGVALSEHAGTTYWLVMNLGDSRTYRATDTGLEQVSVDHSAVQELVDAGILSPAEAGRHPNRNVITKALGAGSHAVPDYWLLPASPGDRMLVCSDGLTRELDDDRIALVLHEESSPQNAAMRLVQEALLHGGRDNVTVIVVDAVTVCATTHPDEQTHSRTGADGGTAFSDDTVPRYVNPGAGEQHASV